MKAVVMALLSISHTPLLRYSWCLGCGCKSSYGEGC